eukprot:15469081-Alexandrium_andersonii.AAC.1
MQHGFRCSELELRRPQKRPQHWPAELPSGAFCAGLRAESDGGNEKRPGGRKAWQTRTISYV